MKTDAEKLREMEEGIRRFMHKCESPGKVGSQWVRAQLHALLPKRYKRTELVEWFNTVRPGLYDEWPTARLLDACKPFIFEEEP